MQKIQISIPEPCHENWQAMTPTEQGRFCNACAKEVVDFSMMTDAEVLGYFTNYKNESVCGRAIPSQLDRTIAMPKEPVKRRFWYWNYITMLFLFFGKSNKINAQTKGKIVTAPVKPEPPVIRMGIVATPTKPVKPTVANTKVIAGKITDENGKGIPFASIKVSGAKYGVAADAWGVYSIKVNDIEKDVLEISATGYSKISAQLSGLSLYNFTLKKDKNTENITNVTMGAAIIVTHNTYTITNVVTTLKGNIKDPSGNPIPFSSIYIKNTKDGVSADAAGNFSIKAKKGSILQISAIDFVTKEISIDVLTKELNIVLQPNTKMLNDVVVQCYAVTGKLKRYTTGTVQIVSGQMQAAQTTTIADTIKTFFSKFTSPAHKIYPNPVLVGNPVTLSAKLKEPGNYFIQITDASGKTVMQKEITASSKQLNQTITTDPRWGRGMYFLVLTNARKEKIFNDSFIVQ